VSLRLPLLQVAELNAKVQELEAQFNAAVEDKEAAIKESERCQLKLQLANRLINALASEGECCWRTSKLRHLRQERACYAVAGWSKRHMVQTAVIRQQCKPPGR
jgi:hypothetical protein